MQVFLLPDSMGEKYRELVGQVLAINCEIGAPYPASGDLVNLQASVKGIGINEYFRVVNRSFQYLPGSMSVIYNIETVPALKINQQLKLVSNSATTPEC